MSKIELPAVTGSNNTSRINDNFQKIEDALNQEVLYRKGYVGEPNEMETNLDMNGKRVLNLPDAVSQSEPVTLGQLENIDSGDALALRNDLLSSGGAGLVGFDHSVLYSPASVGYKLANSIDITDAPYNARANQADISPALIAAAATGRPIYFPEPKNPANYYVVTGLVSVTENLMLHGPRSAKIVFNGVSAGEDHILFTGRELSVSGLTLESTTRGTIIRAKPIDSTGIEYVHCTNTRFKGGFYSIRAGGSVSDPVAFPVNSVVVYGAQSEAPVGQNAGHFLSFNSAKVHYLKCDVKYGKNTSAYGAARCANILIDGCSESGVEQTVTGVEAAAQLEDCEGCSGRIVNNSFQHDIWIASTSGVKVSGNTCRELRITTGSQYTSFDMDDITFSENTAGRINIQKFGSFINAQRVSADFLENTLDPESYSNLGSAYANSYIVQGSVCGLVRFRGNKNISDASANAMQIARDSAMRLEIDDLCRFGTKPHLISGTTGRIVSDISLEDSVPSQGATAIADMLLGFSPDFTPTATGNFANLPFTTLAKNFNSEYLSQALQPIEDCVYGFGGIFTVNSPSDGVRFGVQIYNETDNIVVSMLVDTKLWSGDNSVPLLGLNIKLFSGKVYRLRYITGNTACVIKSGIANTHMSIKNLV